MNCHLKLRRHKWHETSHEVGDRGAAIGQAFIAPGLVPPEVLEGRPKINEQCEVCGKRRYRFAGSAEQVGEGND